MADTLQAASRLGDIKAIEALINKSFEPKGFTVTVSRRGKLLKILLKGDTEPSHKLGDIIKTGLNKIKPHGFERVFVKSKVLESSQTAWTQEWTLAGLDRKPQVGDASPRKVVKPSKVQKSVKDKQSKQKRNQLLGIGIGLATLVLSGSVLLGLAGNNRWAVIETLKRVSEISLVPTQDVEAEIPDRSYDDAINHARAAVDASKTAVSHDEWNTVASLWREAIVLMKAVPESNENYPTAQAKADEYQNNLKHAQELSLALTPTINLHGSEGKVTFNQAEVGFTFESSPLNDGTPRLLGHSPDGLAMIELYGTGNNITEATLTTFITQGMSDSQTALLAVYKVAFLNAIAPGYEWDAWISESLLALSNADGGEKRTNAGDIVASIALKDISGVAVIFVSVEPK
ncbi:MAG: hypothetical protein AAF215_15820 [Cyanobacteria bacterium P01_A01_bin.123]